MSHTVNRYSNVLTDDEIATILANPEVQAAKAKLRSDISRSLSYFSIALPESVKASVQARLGLDLSAVQSVPMRWIKGDTVPHTDHAAGDAAFENTYLVYITDSEGSLLIDGTNYDMTKGTGYVFNEGLSHSTVDAAGEPRLLLGPMNEAAIQVGSPLLYYATEADALANINVIGYGGGWTVQTFGGFTHWRLASNSTGTSSQVPVYTVGNVLNSDGNYYLYPAAPCFLEGSKILALVDGKETYVPVETLRKGDLVKTSKDGYKKVEVIGSSPFVNPGTAERLEARLYKCSKEVYPALSEDLYITGCHSILVDELTEEQRSATKKSLGKIFVTDGKYRLMAAVDERAEPWANAGTYTVWHFALENKDIYMNYGVYANGGLLVETSNLWFMREKSNMTLH